jgi:hypothetical protein
MDLLKYLTIFLIITATGVLYDKYSHKYDLEGNGRRDNLIKQYLLNDDTEFSEKPILWIHVDHEINGRNWTSFNSRNNTNLNQPYIILCIKSIIKHCGESFNISLIDDDSFEKLIPNWNVSLSELTEPIKSHFRRLALVKLLYYYGGMNIPCSMVVLKDLLPLYEEGVQTSDMFTMEGINHGSSADKLYFLTDMNVLGCKKNSQNAKLFMHYLEKLAMSDNTNETEFLGLVNNWLHQKNCSIGVIDGKKMGIKTKNNKKVGIEKLLSKSYIDFDENMLHAIYIPKEDILKRTKYQWFARMSEKQIIESDLIISKYLTLSQIPM